MALSHFISYDTVEIDIRFVVCLIFAVFVLQCSIRQRVACGNSTGYRFATFLARTDYQNKPSGSRVMKEQGLASISKRKMLTGTTAFAAALLTAPSIIRAQAKALKIGVLLPRTGYMAPTGQASHRGATIATKVLSDYGYNVELVHLDTESSVDAARISAERMVSEGVQCIVGNVDSGGTMAIAQVCEQQHVPLVVNVGAAPQITEQGYKYVARNFPHAGMLMSGGLRLIKSLLEVTKLDAKTAVFLYANDTFGQAQRGALDALFPRADLPFKMTDYVAFDPRAQDLSVEVTKVRVSNPDIVMVVTRGNDAAKIIREMVRQRFTPKAIISPGSSGMFEEEYYQTLGPLADYTIFHLPWANPKAQMTKALESAFTPAFPNFRFLWNASMLASHSRPSSGSRCFQEIGVDARSRTHEGYSRDKYSRSHHHRSTNKVRREGTKCRHTVGVRAESQSNTNCRAANGSGDHGTVTSNAIVAGPELIRTQ